MRTWSYDLYYQRFNVFNETLTENGTVLSSYRDYVFNEYGEITQSWGSKEPKQVDVYKWEPGEKYSYQLLMEAGDYTLDLTKTREFKSIDTVYIKDKTYEAARFYDYYSTTYYYKGDFDGVENIIQYSWYAKGVGMIRYRRFNTDGVDEYELSQILSMKEFNRRKTKFRMYGE